MCSPVQPSWVALGLHLGCSGLQAATQSNPEQPRAYVLHNAWHNDGNTYEKKAEHNVRTNVGNDVENDIGNDVGNDVCNNAGHKGGNNAENSARNRNNAGINAIHCIESQ